MPRYHIFTVGCQMNEADSEALAARLRMLGYREGPLESADLIVLNSCSVREAAEARIIGKLGTLKALKASRPNTVLALMGCMVDARTDRLKQQFPQVDIFARPQAFDGLIAELESLVGPFDPDPDAVDECADMASAEGTPVARFVPIIHGCDKMCSFCIIPFRRGRERSRPVDEIAQEVTGWVRRGVKEVTLLGQNVDSYGHDLPDAPDLADLLAVVNAIDGLWRIRFLTSHPNDMSQKLIQAVADLPKACEHINLPVQAGDDRILADMRRGYTVGQYREVIGRIRATIPGVSLATDIIVGYPGETAAEFQRTLDLLAEIQFDKVHVAMYSPRPGTRAYRLGDDVPPAEKKRRLQAIERLQEVVCAELNRPLLDQTVEVLVEGEHKGKWQGRTRSNKLVFVPNQGEDLAGELVDVRITRTGPWALGGELTAETRARLARRQPPTAPPSLIPLTAR